MRRLRVRRLACACWQLCVYWLVVLKNKYIKHLVMFFGNPQLLERSLHNDLNTFIKNIKAREDQHLTLLQYNKAVILQLS